MGMTESLWLLRHPPSLAPTRTCYGWTDYAPGGDLALPPGLPQADVAVWASDLQRCAVPAQALADALRVPLQTDRRLRELHFGTWEGMPWDGIPPAQLDPWMADFVYAAPPGGEAFAQLAARVYAWWQAAQHNAATVLVVAHAGSIRSLLSNLLGTPLVRAFDYPIDYGHAYHLRLGVGSWQVAAANLPPVSG